MRGAVVVEVMAMVMVSIVVAVMLYHMFTSEAPAEKPTEEGELECRSNSDCKGAAKICMKTGNPVPVTFCGCFDTEDCWTGICGEDNRCH